MEIFTRTIALLLWGFDLILFGAMLFGGLIVLITMSKAMKGHQVARYLMLIKIGG